MNTRKTIAALAVMSLAIAPIAAQAGTRAGTVDATSASIGGEIGTRSSKPISKDNKIGPKSIVLVALLLFGGGGSVAAIASGGSDKSGGT
ncbi:MAG: hypothetical protein KUG65_04480 [Sphingomonadaceae bacterium]|nr:hypothetical protein [Sphingomonadaceae bacterium]